MKPATRLIRYTSLVESKTNISIISIRGQRQRLKRNIPEKMISPYNLISDNLKAPVKRNDNDWAKFTTN